MIPLIGYISSYDEDRIFFEKPSELFHNLGVSLIFLSHTTERKYINHYVKILDGLVIGGGLEDISPKWQNEKPHSKLQKVDEVRDFFEIELIKQCSQSKIPILGICRGLQIINTAFGGSLFQDIADQYGHKQINHNGSVENIKQYLTNPNMHEVFLNKSSKLFNIVKTKKLLVNSFHHQAIKDLADGFLVSSRSEDQLIESIESKMHDFIVGVQWHIELLGHDANQLLILKSFLSHTTRDYV